MKLRTQLLLAGALTLLVPLAAFQAIQQMDTALRDVRSVELKQQLDNTTQLLGYSGALQNLNPPVRVGQHADMGALKGAGTPTDIYAESVRYRMVLDGYADDWLNMHQKPLEFYPKTTGRPLSSNNSISRSSRQGNTETGASGRAIKVRVASSASHLYLFIEVPGDQVVFHDWKLDELASGDYIELFLQEEEGPVRRSVFAAVAPGILKGRHFGPRFEGVRNVIHDSMFRGVWVSENSGYQLELQLPLPADNSLLGFAVVDRDRPGETGSRNWVGTTDPMYHTGSVDPLSLHRLVLNSPAIVDVLDDVVPAGSRARVFDRAGHLRGEVNRLYEQTDNPALINPGKTHFFNAVLFRFFEWLIRKKQQAGDQPFTSGNRFFLDEETRKLNNHSQDTVEGTGDDVDLRGYTTLGNDHVLGALTSMGDDESQQSFLVLDLNEERTNAFTSSAMVRLFSLVTLVSLLVAGCLLVFASWLSLRIRKLSRDTRSAVTRDGKFARAVMRSNARDEIGDLSRDFASLVERSAGYTQYLESLASKLSHELRTPLSVVQTSLENLDSSQISDENRVLLGRAQGGSEQLGRLIKSMSEAARLEHTVQNAEFQHLDIAQWLQNVRMLYSDLYPQWKFVIARSPDSQMLYGVPELLQQSFDKLVSNAVDFTPTGGTISFSLLNSESGRQVSKTGSTMAVLMVENEGKPLPDDRLDGLFEPMVSDRSDQVPGRDAESNAHTPHLGLGLYIVKLICEAHGGKVFARNTDSGVLFGFSLRVTRQ